MKSITINLSSFGFNNYSLSIKGELFKEPARKEIKADKLNRLYLVDNSGREHRTTLKKLYKKVFNKEFCVDCIQNLSGEEWKEIENTKGKYFVSNYGRIKSYCGYKAIILKPYINEKGYLIVKINSKNIKIHQIVAFAFCENKYKGTETKIEIHHKNTNRQDNKAENLQIVSVKEHHKIHSKKETTDNE